VPFIATLSGNGLDPLFADCQRGGLPLVDFCNEQAAAYAADVYARLTGRLGVCAVSSGVAPINAMAGLVNAYFDGVPVLFISGCSESNRIGAGSFQDLDQMAVAAPVCKYAKLVDRAERLPFFL
jgi:acetolactate synthase I/II/III large subunit